MKHASMDKDKVRLILLRPGQRWPKIRASVSCNKSYADDWWRKRGPRVGMVEATSFDETPLYNGSTPLWVCVPIEVEHNEWGEVSP